MNNIYTKEVGEIINEGKETSSPTKRRSGHRHENIIINQLKRFRDLPPKSLGKKSWRCPPNINFSQTLVCSLICRSLYAILKQLICCKVPKLIWPNHWCHNLLVSSTLAPSNFIYRIIPLSYDKDEEMKEELLSKEVFSSKEQGTQ